MQSQHLPAVCLALISGLLALAGPAFAGDAVEGEAFSFRLPAEYRAVSLGELAGGQEAAQALAMLERSGGGLDRLDHRYFARYQGSDREAVLAMVVFAFDSDRVSFQGAGNRPSLDWLEAQFRAGLRIAEAESGGRIADASVGRVTLGDGQEVLEISFTAEDPDDMQFKTARMLYYLDERAVLMLAFEGLERNAAIDEPAWRSVVGTLRIDTRPAFLRLAAAYWPFATGGLAVLVLGFLLFRKPRARAEAGDWKRAVADPAPADSTPRPAGAGLSRALDGLPIYGDEVQASPAAAAQPHAVDSAAQAQIATGPPKVGSGLLRKPTVSRAIEQAADAPTEPSALAATAEVAADDLETDGDEPSGPAVSAILSQAAARASREGPLPDPAPLRASVSAPRAIPAAAPHEPARAPVGLPVASPKAIRPSLRPPGASVTGPTSAPAPSGISPDETGRIVRGGDPLPEALVVDQPTNVARRAAVAARSAPRRFTRNADHEV